MAASDPLHEDFLRRWIPVQEAVAGFCHAALADPVAADDAVQETALALLQAHHRYDPARPFIGWAIGVARTCVGEQRRRRGRGGPAADPAALEALAAAAADEGREPEREAELRALAACLDGLRGRPAELMRLHHGEGLAPADVAARLALRPDHVRTLLHRVRAALRACIERRLAGAAR
jgi:RNA polymerase sigma-70 factor (ECF subfamily)